MKNVPIHKLEDRSSLGFQLVPFCQDEIDHKKSKDMGAHRDDHYLFFIMLEGSGSTIVDFEEKIIGPHSIYYILPEQIHHRIKSHNARGWFLAADPSLVSPECRNNIESWLGFHEPIALEREEINDLDMLLTILHRRTCQYNEAAKLSVLHSLLGTFFEMASHLIGRSSNMQEKKSRATILSMQFKELLNENIKEYKSPFDYAEMLHISESYLNEVIKKITGSTVSFWIRFKIMTEAKRLLYFTDLNTKQIANELGFDNHSYFSHLFSKEVGMSPLTFRKRFREDQ